MTQREGKLDKALVVGQTTASLAGQGPLAAALKLAGMAAGRLRDRRFEKMWKHVVSGMDDPVAFTEWVESRLLEDGDIVSEGFVAAAQAAADAVTPVAVASIGLLARAFLTEQRPARRTYRGVLALLRSLDDEEYGALRTAAHHLVEVGEDPASTILHRPTPDAPLEWLCRNPPKPVLAVGELAGVLVAALAPLVEEPPLGEQTAETNVRGRPRVPLSLSKLLVEVMPLPEPLGGV